MCHISATNCVTSRHNIITKRCPHADQLDLTIDRVKEIKRQIERGRGREERERKRERNGAQRHWS